MGNIITRILVILSFFMALHACSSSTTTHKSSSQEIEKPILINPPPIEVKKPVPFKVRLDPAKLLSEHNKVRAKYKVPPLSWSPKLASFSTQWAEHLKDTRGCKPKHRPLNGAFKTDYGENIYWASAFRWDDGTSEVNKTTAPAVVHEWAKEVKDYNYQTNRCLPGRKCGHYRQVVWRSTKKVGCGLAVCADKSQVWVCSYDPPGHWQGVRPY